MAKKNYSILSKCLTNTKKSEKWAPNLIVIQCIKAEKKNTRTITASEANIITAIDSEYRLLRRE